jgi:hypothetical protein
MKPQDDPTGPAPVRQLSLFHIDELISPTQPNALRAHRRTLFALLAEDLLLTKGLPSRHPERKKAVDNCQSFLDMIGDDPL